MKQASLCSFALLSMATLAVALAGCFSPSPYEFKDSWAIRQNDIPQYATQYDIIYFYPELLECDWRLGNNAPAIYDGANEKLADFQVKQDSNGKVLARASARVFVPFVHADTAAVDMKDAIKYYLGHYHDAGRPFLLMAEGNSVQPLGAAMHELRGKLKPKNGLVATFIASNRTDEVEYFMARGRAWAYRTNWVETPSILPDIARESNLPALPSSGVALTNLVFLRSGVKVDGLAEGQMVGDRQLMGLMPMGTNVPLMVFSDMGKWVRYRPLHVDDDFVMMATRAVRSHIYERRWEREAPANTNDVPQDVLEALHVRQK